MSDADTWLRGTFVASTMCMFVYLVTLNQLCARLAIWMCELKGITQMLLAAAMGHPRMGWERRRTHSKVDAA